EAGFVAIRGPVLQDSQKNLLHQVLGDLAPTGHPVEEIEERHVIAVEEGPELAEVPLADGPHQGFIVHGHSPVNTGEDRKGYREMRSALDRGAPGTQEAVNGIEEESGPDQDEPRRASSAERLAEVPDGAGELPSRTDVL